MSKGRKEAGDIALHKFLINLALPLYGQFAHLRGHWAVKKFSDDKLNEVLKIKLDVARLLPDVVLADLTKPALKLVFVEVVSTDGPVTEQRKAGILELLAASPMGYAPEDAVFVTAYRDRGARPVPKAIRELAWGSFAWFMSEPDNLVQLHDVPPRQLKELLP